MDSCDTAADNDKVNVDVDTEETTPLAKIDVAAKTSFSERFASFFRLNKTVTGDDKTAGDAKAVDGEIPEGTPEKETEGETGNGNGTTTAPAPTTTKTKRSGLIVAKTFFLRH
jgi:heme-binding NEAT domain protein